MLLLGAAVPVVFFPVVFGPYTLASGSLVADESVRFYSNENPILDTAASIFQDEPWLYTLREHLRAGRLPLVNLRNGLGATFAESLQPGVFYPLNLLLLLTGGEGVGYFDFFSLLHVAILLGGLYALFRLYCVAEVACALAILVGFTGYTFIHVNMVHFRGFVWLPLMLWGAIRVARGAWARGPVLVLMAATALSATAGNLQDCLMSLLTTAAVGSAEAVRSRKLGGFVGLGAGLGLGLALASPAILPYLASLRDGNLSSVGAGARCLYSTPPEWFTPWVLPGVAGTNSMAFIQPVFFDRQPDFTTVGFFLLCVGVVLAVGWGGALSRGERGLLAFLLGLLGLFLLKLLNVPPFHLCAELPFISGVRFTKYCLHNAVLAGLIAAISAQALTRLSVEERRKVVLRAGVLLGGCVLALALYVAFSDAWGFKTSVRQPRTRAVVAMWLASLLTVGAFIAVMARARRPAWLGLAVLFLVQAFFLRPTGYSAARPALVPTTPALREAGAADKRVLGRMFANTNLFFGYEEVSLFDPIHNRAFGDFMRAHFELYTPVLHVQPTRAPEELTPKELDVLRLLGVELVEGRALPAGLRASTWEGLMELEGRVPKAFVLRPEAFAQADARCRAGDISGALKALRAGLGPPVAREADVNRLVLSGVTPGRLVVAQAFSTAWRLDGASGTPFCGLYPSWPVESARERVVVEYWPPGLSLAVWLALGAALLVGLGVVLAGLRGLRAGRRRPVLSA